MSAGRTYARLEGSEPVEVRVHPAFVTWAGQKYAVVARTDDPNPARPAWRVIASTRLLSPRPDIPRHGKRPQ